MKDNILFFISGAILLSGCTPVSHEDWDHIDYVAIDCQGPAAGQAACKSDPNDHINDTSRGRGGRGR